jgi:dihydrolipoamide dehydrogenase
MEFTGRHPDPSMTIITDDVFLLHRSDEPPGIEVRNKTHQGDMAMRNVDVAIIGAGHAGLNALKEVKKATDNWVLINGGQLGTTCARVGCMPSKGIIEVSRKYNHDSHGGQVDPQQIPELLEKVRDYRDIFVDLVLANTTDNMVEGEELIEGYATFVEPNLLMVNDQLIRARKIIIATGSHPVIPPEWQSLEDHILTSESLFELENLPNSVGVIGLGYVGLEMAQALHRLGVKVVGVGNQDTVAGIRDSAINRQVQQIFNREFPLHLGHSARLTAVDGGVRIEAGDLDIQVEKVFLSVGRRPNIPAGLEMFCKTDERDIPCYNPSTLQIDGLPVFIAGDAIGRRMMLQDAAEEGHHAGSNACLEEPVDLPAKTPLSIIFTEPNICQVGPNLDELTDVVIGEQRFGPIGRAIIMGSNRGLIRLYAEPGSGRMLGACMVGPRVEHLAHLVAWSVQQQLTVQEMLEMPFYHPVIEEALQDALKDTAKKLAKQPPPSVDTVTTPESLPRSRSALQMLGHWFTSRMQKDQQPTNPV